MAHNQPTIGTAVLTAEAVFSGAVAVTVVRGALRGAASVADDVVKAADDAVKESSEIIYRSGKTNPGNLTPSPGEEALSFKESISNPLPPGARPVFRPGDDYFGVDVSKLPPWFSRLR